MLEYSFGSDAGEASIVGETSSGFEGGETSTTVLRPWHDPAGQGGGGGDGVLV